MRVGQNPAKSVDTVAKPAKITVAVVVNIPFLGGYYQHSLDVLKLCLASIWQNTHLPYDLMVFDNASCEEVRSYLAQSHAEGKIQFLTLSDKNIGKVGAWNFIFGGAPGEYIAYADADVYHFPGWLAPQIEALETFPATGMVTGMPLLSPEQYSTATVQWAENTPEAALERGQLLPWEDFWRHAGTLGGGEKKARAFYQDNPSLRLTMDDKQYYVGAAHFQFVARKGALAKVGPLQADRPMGQVRQLDEAMNDLGFLRLSTPEWHVQHLGNTMPGEAFLAGEGAGLSAPSQPNAPRRLSFWALKPVQKIVRWLYSKSFDILYRN
jgi:hypothetical protein